MAHKTDVQVGDVGTVYKARIIDADEDFDPTDATVTNLIFSTPSGVLTRAATVTTEGEDEQQKWYLNYVVVFDDVALGLHLLPGIYQWQGYIKFSNDEYYRTSIARYIVGSNLDD